ncbi:MAG: hypothetical protein JJ969_08955 [Rhizobiaceae bacterium]|nr:hypothetical protein [Rhizobiaceae bacterium]MBO6725161.1 hypothetical protein [Rhizobiaceae bacterium]
MPEEYTKTEARQGRRGRPVLIVLIVALVLAAIAWWGAEIYGMIINPGPSEEISQIDSQAMRGTVVAV